MEGHKIRLVFLTGICLLLLGAVSCKGDLSTSSNFSEDEVNAAALSVIALLNEGDYDRLYTWGMRYFRRCLCLILKRVPGFMWILRVPLKGYG